MTKSILLVSCITSLMITIMYAQAADHISTKSMTIYKYIDAKGVLHLTNKPPKPKDQLLYARSYLIQSLTPPPKLKPQIRAKHRKYKKGNKHRKYKKYASAIEKIAHKVNLPPALLHAVVQVESAYNPKARSNKGAMGLMQLMPATAKRYGVTNRTDPVANLNGGARYLRDLLTMFNENLSLALAAYNAGENAVKRYGNTIPPYRETRHYVKKVKKLYHQHLSNL